MFVLEDVLLNLPSPSTQKREIRTFSFLPQDPYFQDSLKSSLESHCTPDQAGHLTLPIKLSELRLFIMDPQIQLKNYSIAMGLYTKNQMAKIATALTGPCPATATTTAAAATIPKVVRDGLRSIILSSSTA
jgi:hypothetical protein